MKRILAAFIFFAFLSTTAHPQVTRYMVKLKDKNGTPYTLSNPISYLSQRAIDRRTRYNISYDSTDLPCTPSYINQIRTVPNVTILNISKWLNEVTIQTSDANAIATINGFNFVQSVTGVAARLNQQQDNLHSKIETESIQVSNGLSRNIGILSDFYNYGTNAFNEIHLHNGEFLHNLGLRGQPMQIAVLDDGFFHYTTISAFDSAILNGQILGIWDFVSLDGSVVEDDSHGMSCLSTMVSNLPGQFVGMAPKASFYLYRTEDPGSNNEWPIEEHNWACGAEKADSTGADVITTSLGYTYFLSPMTASSHTYADMNGNTTMSAIAADLAAKKGILVFAAVGNDGVNSWHFLGTPSDGDSVIAVGAVTPAGVTASISSWGPSSDGQIKPDMVSVGANGVIVNSSGTVTSGLGTSFATPKMAGLGTCLWQGFPEFNNMKIRSALWLAGDSASSPTNHRGYGLPNVKKAFVNLLIDFSTANGSITNCKTTLNWTSKDISAMRYEIERKLPGAPTYTKVYDVASVSGVSVLGNHSYVKTDTLISVPLGVISYRIRQIVDTAAATFTDAYTDTVNINLAAGCFPLGINPVDPNKLLLAIIPNPAYTQQFTLKIVTQNPINNLNIQIVDMKGRLVSKFNKSKPAGSAIFDLPIQKLAKGKYIVTVYDSNKILGSKELIRL